MKKNQKKISRRYQPIRLRQLRRKKVRMRKRKVLTHMPKYSSNLPIPRKIRRLKTKPYSTLYNRDKLSFKARKSLYLRKHLPPNLEFLLKTKESPFFLEELKLKKYHSNGEILIPEIFSIIENPKESYQTLKKIVSALFVENNKDLILDYQNCIKVELGSQVLLDIILKDFFRFIDYCTKIDRYNREYFPSGVGGTNINNEGVQKMMFSVGSPVTLKVKEHTFSDIIPYKLCIHDNEKIKNYDRRIEQKELDTTEMADYVIECLGRMNKKLTPSKRDDLCTVIGEILINAEEHSSTKYRFSIGYFKEVNIEGNHYGIFRLVILNFGQTIYNKFKDEECQNKAIVSKMENLSSSYTKRNLFHQREFEEESLWTLYALQEEVSSVSPSLYKRGNGSIRFIESFFNIKGSNDVDAVSFLTIQSGKTRIHFNGEYGIQNKTNSMGETFKVMTFNDSGSIEEMPDKKYVNQTTDFFPGTIISAKLLFNDDDVEQIIN
jgi:hypothetical protein